MIKFTALLPRHPSMTHEEFVRYHKDVHAPLLISDPVIRKYVRRYEQCHTGPEIAGLPAAIGVFESCCCGAKTSASRTDPQIRIDDFNPAAANGRFVPLRNARSGSAGVTY